MKCATGVAFAAATFLAGAASAAALSGTFNVTAYKITNLNSVQSEASAARFDAAVAGTLGGADLVISSDDFTFIGSLDFETQVGSSTTIGSWLASNPDGGGAISGLDGTFGGLRQSKRRVGSSTATRTFYLFEPVAPLQASGFTIVHDDGISLFAGRIGAGALADLTRIGGNLGPTSKRTTNIEGFTGSDFTLLYVATNSDPSILNVEATPVPLLAGLPLLAVGLGGLFALRRRRARP